MNALLFPLAFVSPAVFLAFMLGLKDDIRARPSAPTATWW